MLLDGDPPQYLLYDELEECPYLEGEVARMPLRLPVRPLTLAETERSLARGDRRHGRFLYRPSCPQCRECEAIRLDVRRFAPGRTHRRILRRGDDVLQVRMGEPSVSDQKLALYEKHKRGRGLVSRSGKPIDAKGYFGFLVDRCVDAFELSYMLDDVLVGVAITDRAEGALSAVYCYFEPELTRLSIGTYSILKLLEICRAEGLAHLYLGLYIRDNPHMSYKGQFLPHERLIDGTWQIFERDAASGPLPAG